MPTLEEQTHTSYVEVSRPRIKVVLEDITCRVKFPLRFTLKIRHPHVGLRETSQSSSSISADPHIYECFFFFLLNWGAFWSIRGLIPRFLLVLYSMLQSPRLYLFTLGPTIRPIICINLKIFLQDTLILKLKFHLHRIYWAPFSWMLHCKPSYLK